MLTLEDARERLLKAVPRLGTERIAIRGAAGRIARADVAAAVPLPLFDNCSMDGYALRSSDTSDARAETPARLQVVGESLAGRPYVGDVPTGACVRVFTGSRLPQDCNAVVMQEDVIADPAGRTVAVSERVPAWENVRLRGEDIPEGARLIAAGDRIRSAALGAIAAVGIAELTVGRRPRVTVVSTGDELAPPGDVLKAGQIYESNTVLIGDLLEKFGGTVVGRIHAPDELSATREALLGAAEASDLVVTIGGASVGDHDWVRRGVEAAGGDLGFWRISMKPGKPFFFGSCRGIPVMGLPGNPVSAFVTATVLVGPAMRAMQGAAVSDPLDRAVILGERLINVEGRRHFMRVRSRSDGRMVLAGGQHSHFLSSLALAEGVVDVGPGRTFEAGETVRMIVWD